ncbi:MAG: arginase [Dehalococcoidia bacterium]
MASVHLIGVPIDLGAGRRGTDMGPSALRLTDLRGRLGALGHQVTDLGNVDVAIPESCDEGDPHQRFAAPIAEVCERLAERTRRSAEAGAIPLVLGGDHSLAMGSISGVAAALKTSGRALGAIWVDAHADMNTPASSPSGNVHGMPLAALLGKGPQPLAGIAGISPAIRPEHTVLLGIRDLDEREKAIVRKSGVTAITMTEIDRAGFGPMADRAVAVAGGGTAGIYVSFDMDAVDPGVAPGVGTPVPGGLSYRESHLLMEVVAETGSLLGMDVVEINPSLDTANATAELGTQLALSALGRRIL